MRPARLGSREGRTRRPSRASYAVLAALLAAALAGASRPSSASVLRFAAHSQSSNWSGYSVTAPDATFTDVKGTWIQPAVTCVPGQSYSSFWIGLGGWGADSQGLEQTGTSGDCDLPRPTYYAWYELIPAPAVTLPLSIRPGDAIAAQVTHNPDATVSITVRDLTQGTNSVIQLQVPSPDYTSAEWIAEAPSHCSAFSRNGCRVEPLANFGTVAFTNATATANGHEGTIADPAWTPDPVTLEAVTGETAAAPSELSPDGGSFNVTWHSTGGPLKLAIAGFRTAPATPRAGHTLTASLTLASTNPVALATALVSCRATAGGVRLRVVAHAMDADVARCTWALPASWHHRALVGSVTAVASDSSATRAFKVTIR